MDHHKLESGRPTLVRIRTSLSHLLSCTPPRTSPCPSSKPLSVPAAAPPASPPHTPQVMMTRCGSSQASSGCCCALITRSPTSYQTTWSTTYSSHSEKRHMPCFDNHRLLISDGKISDTVHCFSHPPLRRGIALLPCVCLSAWPFSFLASVFPQHLGAAATPAPQDGHEPPTPHTQIHHPPWTSLEAAAAAVACRQCSRQCSPPSIASALHALCTCRSFLTHASNLFMGIQPRLMEHFLRPSWLGTTCLPCHAVQVWGVQEGALEGVEKGQGGE